MKHMLKEGNSLIDFLLENELLTKSEMHCLRGGEGDGNDPIPPPPPSWEP